MAAGSADASLATWAPTTSPLRIEYSTSVMEEIRARAVEGYYKLIRGGVEVAGLLIGEYRGDHIRVLSHQPFEIEYAYGPVFLLSPRDLAFLRELVEDVKQQHGGSSMGVVGFYVSHSRGELNLKENEAALFADLFPHPWQVALILKPSRAPETPAAFFVREADGSVSTDRSLLEFELVPFMGERRPRPARRTPADADASLQALAQASGAPGRFSPRPDPTSGPAPAWRSPRPPVSDPSESAVADAVSPHPRQQNDPALAEGAVAASREALSTDLHANDPYPSDHQLAEPTSADPQQMLFGASTSSGDGVDLPVDRNTYPDTGAAQPAEPANLLVPAQSAPPQRSLPVVEWLPRSESSPHSDDVADLGKSASAAAVAWEDEPSRTSPASSRLRFVAPAVALVVLLVIGYLAYVAFTREPAVVVFYKRIVDGRTEVVWTLSGVRDAASAQIVIENKGERKVLDLMRTGQLSGSFVDPMLTPDAVVTLDVQRTDSPAIQQVASWVGSRPPAPNAAGSAGTATGAPSGSTPPVSSQADLALDVKTPGTTPAEESPKAEDTSKTLSAEEAEAAALAKLSPRERARFEREKRRQEEREKVEKAREDKAAQDRIREEQAREQKASEEREAAARTAAEAARQSRLSASSTPAPSSPVSRTNITADSRPVSPIAEAPATATAQVPNSQPATSAPTAGPSSVNPSAPSATTPRATASTPAPSKPRAGRLIWTGQLRKNQTLQITGNDANQGAVNASLPGAPVRLSVLPGELTSNGLVVYTANPRYRDTNNAVEAPGPTNGWNRTRYRYDPARANSIIVTAIPNQTNRWQGVTVRNDDKTVNVIVVDWLADTDN